MDEIRYVFSSPSQSPNRPAKSTAAADVKKLSVIYILFINTGRVFELSKTKAISTGPGEKIKNPRSTKKTKLNHPSELTNKNIIIGDNILIISKVDFLPNLSEILPESIVPTAPAN